MTWHECASGRRWGARGAAGVLLRHGSEVYLAQRGPDVSWPWTWSIPGGALEGAETPLAGALREAYEEVGYRGPGRPTTSHVASPCPCWRYTTFVIDVETKDVFDDLDLEETADERWVDVDDLAALELHPALAAALSHLLTAPVNLFA